MVRKCRSDHWILTLTLRSSNQATIGKTTLSVKVCLYRTRPRRDRGLAAFAKEWSK